MKRQETKHIILLCFWMQILYLNKEHLRKFNHKVFEGIFLGYSSTNKAHRGFNKKLGS